VFPAISRVPNHRSTRTLCCLCLLLLSKQLACVIVAAIVISLTLTFCCLCLPLSSVMPQKRAADSQLPSAAVANVGDRFPKRQRKPTQRAIESDELPCGTASQPIELPETQPAAPEPPLSPQPSIPSEAIVEVAADVAVDPLVGRVVGAPERPWELRLLESQPVTRTPLAALRAATEALLEEDSRELGRFDARFVNNFKGIN
jgi:hypothetical protein